MRIAHDAGFQAVEVALPDIAHEEPADVLQTLAEAGLRPGGVPLPVEFRLDERRFADDLGALPYLAELAASIGVRSMYRSIPASSDLPRSELAEILQGRLSTCAAMLREAGITLAIEVLGPLHRRREGRHEFVWRLREGLAFARSCGPGVGLLVDSWHWHHAGDTAQDIVDVGGAILHVHVADAPDIPAEDIRDDERLLPGEGIVDFASFVDALAAVGYAGLVTPEVPGGWCGAASRVECARLALAATTASLRRASRVIVREP